MAASLGAIATVCLGVSVLALLAPTPNELAAREKVTQAEAAIAGGDFRAALALLNDAERLDPAIRKYSSPLRTKATEGAEELAKKQASLERGNRLQGEIKIGKAKEALAAGDMTAAAALLAEAERLSSTLSPQVEPVRVMVQRALHAAARAEAIRLAQEYDIRSGLPGAVEFVYDRPISMSSCGVLKRLTFRSAGVVEATYENDTNQRVKPDILIWILNKDGVVLWSVEDSWEMDSLAPGQTKDQSWSYQLVIDRRFSFSQWARRPGVWDLKPYYVLAAGSKYALEKLTIRLVQQIAALAQASSPSPDEGYDPASVFKEVVPFEFDRQMPLPSSGIVKSVIFSSSPYVDAHYMNDTEQRVKPDVIVWVMNREGVVLWEGRDSWVMDSLDPGKKEKKSWSYAFQIGSSFAFSRWAREPGGWDLKPAYVLSVGSKYAFDQLVATVKKQVEDLNRQGASAALPPKHEADSGCIDAVALCAEVGRIGDAAALKKYGGGRLRVSGRISRIEDGKALTPQGADVEPSVYLQGVVESGSKVSSVECFYKAGTDGMGGLVVGDRVTIEGSLEWAGSLGDVTLKDCCIAQSR